MLLRFTLIVFMGLGYNNLYGQEQQGKLESEQHEIHTKHRLAVAIGQTHIPSGLSENNKSFLVVPTWAFEYEFWFKERWAALGFSIPVICKRMVLPAG